MTVTATKTCLVCDLVFLPKVENQRYCGADCKRVADVKRNLAREWRKRKPTVFEDRVCPVCTQTFTPKAKQQVYDTLKCQHTANKRRQRGKALGKPAAMKTAAERGDAPQPVKRESNKPNLAGDWFPGWRGPYPPWRTPLEIELLESGKGRFVPDETHQTQTSDSSHWSDGR